MTILRHDELPIRYVPVVIRVTDDDKHAIYEQDFDELENIICWICLDHVNEDIHFSIRFEETPDDGRNLRTDDDESE